MSLTIFIISLFGLQAICLFLGSKASKSMKGQDDYFLAGKKISFFPLMMTFLATQVGGGLILGSAEEAYRFGWWVFFYPLGAALGLILLGLGIGRRLAQFQVSTIAQIFEVAYGSAFLKKIASFLSIASLFLIFVAQVTASYKFMHSMGVDNPLWFIGFWAIVIFYTAMGGLKAVVATDIIQASFFILIFLLSFGFSIFKAQGMSHVPVSDFSTFDFSFLKLYGWLMMPLLMMIIEQDMGQRCLAAKSPRTVSKATLWAGIFTLGVGSIPIYFGIMARKFGLSFPEDSSILMSSIAVMTNPAMTALFSAAILAAIISTADSLVNAVGSNISQDFSLFNKENILFSRILSGVIAIGGIFVSFFFVNIVDLLILSYELSVSCLFIPIIFALFKRKNNLFSACLSIGLGAFSFFLFRFVSIPVPKEAVSVLSSLMGFGIGELLALRGLAWENKKGL